MIHKIKAHVRRGARQFAARHRGGVEDLAQHGAQIPGDECRGDRRRTRGSSGARKRLDAHRAYIVHLLETYPRLSAVKVLRKLHEAHGDLAVSARSARRYIRELKETVTRQAGSATTSRCWTWCPGCSARSTAGSCAG